MSVKQDIKNYLSGLPESKGREMQSLNEMMHAIDPSAKIRFESGKNSEGKVVSNPNIGYGSYVIKYANGTTREFYRVGISANTTGISVYIMGLEDKKFLAATYGKRLGKASITGYCIKFRSLNDINVDVLKEAVKYGLDLKGN